MSNKLFKFIFRLLLYPFLVGMLVIAFVRWLIINTMNHFQFGSELVVMDKEMSRGCVAELIKTLKSKTNE